MNDIDNYGGQELFSRVLSLIGFLALIAGLVTLFINWKVGVSILLTFPISMTISVLSEPEKMDKKDIESSNFVKNEIKKVKTRMLIVLALSISALVAFVLFVF